MKPVEIGKAYDQITHLWESDDFNMNNGIDALKKALTFAKGRGNALDIGCGCTGRFIELLCNEGFTPSGLDISAQMLTLARQKQPNIEFIHADICRYQLATKYDLVTAWDSIWHIPLSQQTNVLTNIVNSLNPGGVLLFSFGGTDAANDHSDDFMGPQVYYSSLGTNGFLSLLIELGCVIRHLEFDQYPELHSYLIIEKA